MYLYKEEMLVLAGWCSSNILCIYLEASS